MEVYGIGIGDMGIRSMGKGDGGYWIGHREKGIGDREWGTRGYRYVGNGIYWKKEKG